MILALTVLETACDSGLGQQDADELGSEAADVYQLLVAPRASALAPEGVPAQIVEALAVEQQQLNGDADAPYVMDVLALSMLLSEISNCEADAGDPSIELPPWFSAPQDWQFVGRVRINEFGPDDDQGFEETQPEPPQPEGDFADLPLWKQWLEAQRERAILLDLDTRLAFRSRVDLFPRRNEVLISSPDRGDGPVPQLGMEEESQGAPEDADPVLHDAEAAAGGSGPMEPRSIFGTDGRLHVPNTTQVPWRRAAALRRRNADDSVQDLALCSAAFAGPRHLWTAAHCVIDSNGTLRRAAAPGQSENGSEPETTPFGTFAVRYIFYPSAFRSGLDSATYDWALIVLRDTVGYPSWFGSQSATFGALKNRAHRAIGYPGDFNADYQFVPCANSPNPGGICGGRQYQQLADLEQVFSTSLRSRHDANNGQSGSGIVRFTDSFSTNYVRGILNRGSADWTKSRRLTNYNLQYLCDAFESLPSTEYEASCE